jgi:two-component system, sensor histidine kinase YesM
MFRYTLKSKKFVPLNEELKNAESYLNIQKVRYENSFSYNVNINKEGLTYTVPIFILQPILENSFKYGLFRKEKNYLTILSENTQDYFKIHIVDNGVGVKPNDLARLSAKFINYEGAEPNEDKIGLANVNHRIQLTYGESYGLEVSSLYGHWFKVTILLPPQEVC